MWQVLGDEDELPAFGVAAVFDGWAFFDSEPGDGFGPFSEPFDFAGHFSAVSASARKWRNAVVHERSLDRDLAVVESLHFGDEAALLLGETLDGLLFCVWHGRK